MSYLQTFVFIVNQSFACVLVCIAQGQRIRDRYRVIDMNPSALVYCTVHSLC